LHCFSKWIKVYKSTQKYANLNENIICCNLITFLNTSGGLGGTAPQKNLRFLLHFTMKKTQKMYFYMEFQS